MQYDNKRHVTYVGKIVYERPKKEFKGQDAIRVLLAVSKNLTGSYANWRAIYKISEREMLALLPEFGTDKDPRQIGAGFEEFLKGFDIFVKWYGTVAKYVPGMAWFSNLVTELYFFVRENFPVVLEEEQNERISDHSEVAATDL